MRKGIQRRKGIKVGGQVAKCRVPGHVLDDEPITLK